MQTPLEIRFAPLGEAPAEVTIVLVGPDLAMGPIGQEMDKRSGGYLGRAAKAADFTGKGKQSLELLVPHGLGLSRLVLMAATAEAPALERTHLGGRILAAAKARRGATVSVIADLPGLSPATSAELAAAIGEGALLRAYEFRRYRSKPEADSTNGTESAEGSEDAQSGGAAKNGKLETLLIHTARPEQAAEQFKQRRAVADGVNLARDLVNEPANKLGPVEFADRIRELESAGLDVEILDAPALEKLGMGALLGVAQGSARPARVAIMQWHGAKSKRTKPLCFIGKGVCFDTGGISMKPAAGMEDMKGDMGGAACVTGLMLALAGRKAHVNAVGLVGLVENMPSADAQRPGDIVTSMSGQTIEVLNTDAEGRLVLADVMHYAQERFKPRFLIDLATLTGAILVALGKEHAGLFANNDDLARALTAAGEATGEKVWRMPLGKAYDKMIDSKNADMKNIGGRYAGSITAAQFLQRFVHKDVPWAHLDVAGTAMDSPRTDISQSWASGWGVRLLDRLVADGYEKVEK